MQRDGVMTGDDTVSVVLDPIASDNSLAIRPINDQVEVKLRWTFRW